MLLMRRKHESAAEGGSGAQEESREIMLLGEEIAALRGEIAERDAAKGLAE